MTQTPEIDFSRMPNLFIIGAAKAGTTSLHEVLRQHPEIFMSEIKEPGFFSTEKNYQRGVQWYQDTHFSQALGYERRGESSVNSLYWSEIAAGRIRATYGGREVKFTAIFRDPVQRAYSYYWMHVHTGLETLSFEDALAREPERLRANRESLQSAGRGHFGYFRGGCYASLLQPFLDLFPRACFSFLLLEDLHKDFHGSLARLADFLEVQPGFAFQPVRSNPAAAPMNQELSTFLHHPSGALHRLVKIFSSRLPYPLRNKIRKGINQANRRRQTNPPMPAETERQLRARYQEEIEGLEAILGRDLSAWKMAPGAGEKPGN